MIRKKQRSAIGGQLSARGVQLKKKSIDSLFRGCQLKANR